MCYVLKLKNRLLYGVIVAAIGVMSFVLGIHYRNSLLNDFLAGFYTGTGAALIAVGIVIIARISRILRDEDRRKAAEVKENDERSLFIAGRSGYLTTIIMIPLLYVAMLASGFFNMVVFFTLLIATMVLIAVMLLTYLVVKHKY